MHYRKLWKLLCILAAGFVINAASVVSAAEAEEGERIFAQCASYVNVRSEADENSEAVAKLYRNCAAIVEQVEDGWYKIRSGNAVGYVKAEYFATGEDAEAIAQEVAYRVAVVHAEALNVRETPSEEGTVIDVALASDELEVVDTSGAWATVALGNDVYGYIHPYYCEYKTYYPTAITLEEEAAALAEAQRKEESQTSDNEDMAVQDDSYEDEVQDTENGYEEPENQPASGGADFDGESAYIEGTISDDVTYADGSYAEDGSYADGSYTEDGSYADGSYADSGSYEDGSYTEDGSYADGSYADSGSYEEETGSSDYSLGQQIADYAVQFVGNPYVYGGTSLTNGTDCSGFTQSVMANFGIYLSRTAADQSYGGSSISIGEIQPGDLLFYSDGGGISHVALYIGGGQIVHAATPAQGIIISNYDYSTPVGAARYW